MLQAPLKSSLDVRPSRFNVAGAGFMTSRTGVPSKALKMKEHKRGDEQ
jgi:hypothetical protein